MVTVGVDNDQPSVSFKKIQVFIYHLKVHQRLPHAGIGSQAIKVFYGNSMR
jgi:hypothetical protein